MKRIAATTKMAGNLYFISFVLVLLAIILHFLGWTQIRQGVQIRSHSVLLSESDRLAAKKKGGSFSRRGEIITSVGLALASISAVFAFASIRSGEPSQNSIVFGLLICYLILQMFRV